MSVGKRKWTTSKGIEKEAWVVDYADGQGARRLKTFGKKKDADAFAATASVEVRQGTHVADSASISIKKAGDLWIATAKAAGLEKSTTEQYRQHLELHIDPFIGTMLLSKLNAPAVRAFEDRLRREGRSPVMVRKIIGSLGALLADAQERGLAARNVVRETRVRRRKGKERRQERRHKGKLKVGVDIPARDEIKAIVDNVKGRWRPLMIIAIFAGLRASELRGLRWIDVDLDSKTLHVRQRADRFNQIGRPKSEASERAIPLPPLAVNTLREWKLICPRPLTGAKDAGGRRLREAPKDEHLVFPNGLGKVESHSNIINRGLIPMQLAAGVTVDAGEKDDDGIPIIRAKYTGMHALRHFYASWCINRRSAGGLGLPPKVAQERLGHSSITMTMDVYGHLFPGHDDAEELAAAERDLLA